jgi:hypothetical protein
VILRTKASIPEDTRQMAESMAVATSAVPELQAHAAAGSKAKIFQDTIP